MTLPNANTIQAIDVHGHYGAYSNKPHPLLNELMSGSAEVVIERARQANTAITVVSPLQALMPRLKGDPIGGNQDAARVTSKYPQLRQWAVVNPLQPETYRQAEAMLQQPQCVGIKIHPEEHGYLTRDHGRTLFEFAQKHGVVILTHSGEVNSMPEDFVPFTDEFPEMQLILAHLGCGYDGDPTHQVRAIQAARCGNIWVDTSSAQSLLPGLIEWAVREVGAEKVLFGTDTPLYCAAMQRARIDSAEISEGDKQLILRDNALRLLKLKLEQGVN